MRSSIIFAALLGILAGCHSGTVGVDVGRYSLLGIYKPKGFAIVFDTATGAITTMPLPPALATSGPH